MQVLVLSDIHSDLQSLRAIKEKLIHNKIGLVLLLGDLTNLGGAKEAVEALKEFEQWKTLGFAGNFELPEVQQELEKQGVSLHGKTHKVGKWLLIGFGGGLHGNPGRFLFSEQEVKETLERLVKGKENVILLTHLPPYGTRIDTVYDGRHIGSKAVREIIETHKPSLHLCGHCHEGIGEEKVGGTASINVGAVKDGKALLLELNSEMKWKKVSL